MRTMILAFASTAVRASTPRGEMVGDLEAARAAVQKRQIAPVGGQGFSGGNVILAKGDQTGTGPGLGGQKGKKKGGHKGKQPEGKDNPDKKKAK